MSKLKSAFVTLVATVLLALPAYATSTPASTPAATPDAASDATPPSSPVSTDKPKHTIEESHEKLRQHMLNQQMTPGQVDPDAIEKKRQERRAEMDRRRAAMKAKRDEMMQKREEMRKNGGGDPVIGRLKGDPRTKQRDTGNGNDAQAPESK